MSKLRRNLLLVALFGSLIAVPLALYAHHSWGGYHWARQTNPFTIKLGNNVSGAWQSSLGNASSQWSQSTVLETIVVPGGTRPKSCRPTSGQDEVCSANYGNTGWLGLAQIWITGGTHITQGVVKLNDYYFATGSQYDTPSWRALVTCQEIGHTFGLDHQDTNFNNQNLGTCMDYTSNPDAQPPNTAPNAGDYDQLLCIYDPSSNGKTLSTSTHTCTGTGHLDTSTTVAQSTTMPAAMTAFDLNDPSHWGRLVSGSREKGVSTYDLDFGSGNHIVTYVTWAK